MDELTPEQLEAILGTDYETILTDLLRQKGDAEGRQHEKVPVGQLPSGHVYFDPGGIAQNMINEYKGKKAAGAAQTKMDEVLGRQTAGRKTFAEALTRKPPAPMGAPRSVDASLPEQAAPAVPGAAVAMAPGAPPALANAQQMPPAALQNAGVPQEVQALLARLRGR